MIKHVFMCKLAEPTPEALGEAARVIEGLRGAIDDLLSLEIGIDFKRSPLSYDIVATAHFADRDGLARYSAHPRHRAAVTALQKICSAVAVVDYETPHDRDG